MTKRRLFQAFTAGLLLIVGACSDQNEPVAPSTPPEAPSLQQGIQGTADDPVSLGRTIPGFGGFYLDGRGNPVVYLKRSADRSNAERALDPFLRSHGFVASQLRVLPAQYGWADLESWFGKASPQVLAAGAIFVDADEASNRVRIGVERGAAARIRGIVARLGIPAGAAIVEEVEPIRFASTLRNKVRPVVGGLQINFPGFLCTLGFNAIRNGQNSFITNSHCTNKRGGTEGTPYWQPTQTAAPAQIGTEVSDPAYFKNNGCPPGWQCRFSDAARAAYAAGIPFSLGKLARTTGPNNSSITINGSFSITGEGSASVGQTVNKVGRTTGWTQGKVTQTCVNVSVTGANIGLFCQNIVSARLGAGDSGSPVFKGSSNVTLAGILWGGNSSGTLYVYSPITNIERELGALRTF
ncbi:MAG: hypothetical protein ACJ8BF_09185 [Gemmatimonadales bacterium]